MYQMELREYSVIVHNNVYSNPQTVYIQPEGINE